MFFLPPLHHSHLPFSLNCSHFISSLFYTYTHLLPPFLHPPLPPIVSHPQPCLPILIFAFLFILWLSPCYHHHLPLFDIQLHCLPLPSPWVGQHIPPAPPALSPQ